MDSSSNAMRGLTAEEASLRLLMAADFGEEQSVRKLLALADPNARAGDGCTPLMLAAIKGHVGCIRILAPVSDGLQKDTHGHTALTWAAAMGHADCVQLLISACDPRAIGPDGFDALGFALIGDNPSPCVRLLAPFCDPLCLDDEGFHPFFRAQAGRKWDCVDAMAPFVPANLAQSDFAAAPAGSMPGWLAQMEAAQLAEAAGGLGEALAPNLRPRPVRAL